VTAESKRGRRDEVKLFAVRTVAGRELDVALIMEARARSENLPIRSIIVLPRVKGYIVVEAPAQHYVAMVAHGIRYAKGVVPGVMKFSDIERLLKPEAIVETLKPGEVVEIIAGPFRGMKAEVVRVDVSRNEVVLNLLDASVQYSLQITVPGDSVRPIRGEEKK
jgi:transcriptional antiterminator NusG